MKKILLLKLSFIGPLLVISQTFSNSTGGPVADNNNYIIFPLIINGLSSNLNTSTFGIESVSITIDHTYDSDLRIKLQSPDGNVFVLTSSAGGSDDNYIITQFTDTAITPITSGSAPFTGYFKPIDPLGSVNNGQDGNGTWSLNVKDQVAGDIGNVISWSITFGDEPCGYVAPITFTESNLPIFVITTVNETSIPDEPKIDAFMGIIYNGFGITNYITDPFNAYKNKIGIEMRGSSSQDMFPQKSYGFETRDVNNLVKDTVLLDMPEEHDWILYAPYTDKTCMRNILSYDLSNKMGHYASRTKLCELVLNGEYQGIYILMEKIKKDQNRVNISKLLPTDITGDELTGGYIIKIDKSTGNGGDGWVSNYPTSVASSINILYHYPSSFNIVNEQKIYIQKYVDSFETALKSVNFSDPLLGYENYIGINSFIDYFILNELSKNVDGYRISTYLHKDKSSNGGKLKMGPVWDYNLGFWNADYCQGDVSTGWAYEFNDICGGGSDVPFWWSRFMEDPNFQNKLKCRWTELRQNELSINSLNHFIDSIAIYLEVPQDRYFERWPILGQYVWPNPSPIPNTYSEEVLAIKNWVTNRVSWMDSNIPGTCDATISENELIINNLIVFPNPFLDKLNISLYLTKLDKITIEITDLLGKTIIKIDEKEYQSGKVIIDLNLSNIDFQNGIYLFKIKNSQTEIVQKINKI